MKSTRIYHAEPLTTGQLVELNKQASTHLLKVLRLKDGSVLKLFNGNGFEYTAQLVISGKKAIANIQQAIKNNNESPLDIHLLQGISKGDRMDFAIQKSVELGVSSITPVITERTVVNLKGEREQKKLKHWSAIAISACEQSGRNFVPKIQPICRLTEIFEDSSNDLKLLLDPLSNSSLKSLSPKNNIQILIGPEGGLSDAEIELATDNGFCGVKLGPRILRTETAALAAITSAQVLWGDLN